MKMIDECQPEPPLTCYEKADLWLDDVLEICEGNTDPENCAENAMKDHAEMHESCRLEECYDNAHTEHEPWYAQCYTIEDLVEQMTCLK